MMGDLIRLKKQDKSIREITKLYEWPKSTIWSSYKERALVSSTTSKGLKDQKDHKEIS